MNHSDKTGQYTLDELHDLNDVTAFGGTTPSSWACATFLTISICPTSACTRSCA